MEMDYDSTDQGGKTLLEPLWNKFPWQLCRRTLQQQPMLLWLHRTFITPMVAP
jgi:hypothetical protein